MMICGIQVLGQKLDPGEGGGLTFKHFCQTLWSVFGLKSACDKFNLSNWITGVNSWASVTPPLNCGRCNFGHNAMSQLYEPCH